MLERFFAPVDGRAGTVPVLDAAGRERLEQIAEEEFRHYEASGKTGKRVNWDVARDQILRDLRLFVAIEVRRAAAGPYVPQAVELCFGRRDAPPLVIEAAGRQVKFSGQIDRVDRGPEGQVVVVDYKTGKADRYQDIAKDPLGRGGHLQLPLYAKAVLGMAAGDAVPEHEGGGRLGPRPPAVVVEAGTTACAGGVQVRLGRVGFRHRPGRARPRHSTQSCGASSRRSCRRSTPAASRRGPGELGWMNRYDNCSMCDFNGVCTTDRAESWERASEDRRMSPSSTS